MESNRIYGRLGGDGTHSRDSELCGDVGFFPAPYSCISVLLFLCHLEIDCGLPSLETFQLVKCLLEPIMSQRPFQKSWEPEVKCVLCILTSPVLFKKVSFSHFHFHIINEWPTLHFKFPYSLFKHN